MASTTWMLSYMTKPEWWDDETEPRCDECGVHTEDAYGKVLNFDPDRHPGGWCGECGNCADHCTCN